MYNPPADPNVEVISILRLWLRGLRQRPIAAELNLPYTRVNAVIQRWRKGGYRGLELDQPTAPSPAMIRLAAFDPVIMRALKQREGEGS